MTHDENEFFHANYDQDKEIENDNSQYKNDNFVAFSGKGNRLDGKQKVLSTEGVNITRGPHKRGIPDFDYQIGVLRFIRNLRPLSSSNSEENSKEKSFEAFTGEGKVLIKKK